MVAAIVARELLVSGLRLAAIGQTRRHRGARPRQAEDVVTGCRRRSRRDRGRRRVERHRGLVGSTGRGRPDLGLRSRLRARRSAHAARRGRLAKGSDGYAGSRPVRRQALEYGRLAGRIDLSAGDRRCTVPTSFRLGRGDKHQLHTVSLRTHARPTGGLRPREGTVGWPTTAVVGARLSTIPPIPLCSVRRSCSRTSARHNLILGLAGTLRDHPDVYREQSLLARRGRGASRSAPASARRRTTSCSRSLRRGRAGGLRRLRFPTMCLASSERCPRRASSPPRGRIATRTRTGLRVGRASIRLASCPPHRLALRAAPRAGRAWRQVTPRPLVAGRSSWSRWTTRTQTRSDRGVRSGIGLRRTAGADGCRRQAAACVVRRLRRRDPERDPDRARSTRRPRDVATDTRRPLWR